MSVLRWPLYVWALPTTSLGLVFLTVGAAYGRIGTQVVDGVLEVHGGLIEIFLRKGTLLPGGASAMTLGHVVLGRDRASLCRTRAHERVHVRQCERWGPLFIPAYLLASLLMHLNGSDAYLDNPFEREAFETVPSLPAKKRPKHGGRAPR
jgi:hypothetical protein